MVTNPSLAHGIDRCRPLSDMGIGPGPIVPSASRPYSVEVFNQRLILWLEILR